MPKKILIVDNSIHKKCDRCSQFHRHFSRETSVLHSIEKPLPKHLDNYSHIILTGSAANVDEMSEVYDRLRPFIDRVEKAGVPMLGICYGFQAIIAALSELNSVEHYTYPEIGWTRIYIKKPSVLFNGMPKKFYAFENHLSSVRKLPSELVRTAESHRRNIQAFEHKTKPIYGVQFHPEYTTFHGQLTVTHWLKHRVPFKWFTNINKPSHYNLEIAEKIIDNFYKSSE